MRRVLTYILEFVFLLLVSQCKQPISDGLMSNYNGKDNDGVATMMIHIPIEKHQYEGMKDSTFRFIEVVSDIKEIPDWTFAVNPSLEAVVLSSNVKTIGDNAFFSCKNLHSINLERVDTIGENALRFTAVNTVVLRKIRNIGDFAFADCQKLEKIVFSSTLKKIGDFAFKGDSLLKSCKILTGDIGASAFMGCSNLEEVTMRRVKSVGEAAFLDCSSLKKVVLPLSLDNISPYTFMNCKNLKEITLPKKVKRIGDSAFYGTGLKQIVIPNFVVEIEDNAFAKCDSLRKVVLCNRKIRIAESAFDKHVEFIYN